MTDPNLTSAEIRALRDAATKGPWHVDDGSPTGMIQVPEPPLTIWGFTVATDVTPEKAATIRADARLIAMAPDLATIAADALDEVARLREALKMWETVYSNCTITSGVCCCGDDMECHGNPMNCGHSPVDMGADFAAHAMEIARAALEDRK